jgi:hypothetical protein
VSKTESKEHLLSRMDEEWPKFSALLDSIPESDYDIPGVVDEWCLKELLGHVNFWAAKAAHDVQVAGAGRPEEIKVPGGDANVDKWNAREAAKGKAMPPADLRALVLKSHAEARSALEAAPESALAIEISGWTVGVRFAEDTYRHYREHGEQIGAWARGLETSEE